MRGLISGLGITTTYLQHLGQGHLGRARVEDVSAELQLRVLTAECPRVVLEGLPVASAHAVLDVDEVPPAWEES